MLIFKTISALQKYLPGQVSTGFVPTMGALHRGHLSLIDQSKKENAITVCSIFVNPTQFNDKKDFEKYPVTIDNDIYLLEKHGCDVLFLPSVSDIYPNGTSLEKKYDLGFLETILEGKYRPGHFQGVCQVVHRLLDIVEPTTLYLGQKDYQQCMVITKLVELIGKKEKIKVNICPTLREEDGLAMSSRNMRLNETERRTATTIFKALSLIKTEMKPGDLSILRSKATDLLQQKDFKIDYIEIADASTLQAVDSWDGKQKLVALAAAFLHEIRLIDNMIVSSES